MQNNPWTENGLLHSVPLESDLSVREDMERYFECSWSWCAGPNAPNQVETMGGSHVGQLSLQEAEASIP